MWINKRIYHKLSHLPKSDCDNHASTDFTRAWKSGLKNTFFLLICWKSGLKTTYSLSAGCGFTTYLDPSQLSARAWKTWEADWMIPNSKYFSWNWKHDDIWGRYFEVNLMSLNGLHMYFHWGMVTGSVLFGNLASKFYLEGRKRYKGHISSSWRVWMWIPGSLVATRPLTSPRSSAPWTTPSSLSGWTLH